MSYPHDVDPDAQTRTELLAALRDCLSMAVAPQGNPELALAAIGFRAAQALAKWDGR